MQQSLFEAGGEATMAESASWVESLVLGEFALALCVIAVACIGALMLTGSLPLRQGVRVVIGCFVLLGAQVIATGFAGSRSEMDRTTVLSPMTAQPENARPSLPPFNFDPYAGASLREN